MAILHFNGFYVFIVYKCKQTSEQIVILYLAKFAKLLLVA